MLISIDSVPAILWSHTLYRYLAICRVFRIYFYLRLAMHRRKQRKRKFKYWTRCLKLRLIRLKNWRTGLRFLTAILSPQMNFPEPERLWSTWRRNSRHAGRSSGGWREYSTSSWVCCRRMHAQVWDDRFHATRCWSNSMRDLHQRSQSEPDFGFDCGP